MKLLRITFIHAIVVGILKSLKTGKGTIFSTTHKVSIPIIILRNAKCEAITSVIVLQTYHPDAQVYGDTAFLSNVDTHAGEPGVGYQLHVDENVINVIILHSIIILISSIDVQLKCFLDGCVHIMCNEISTDLVNLIMHVYISLHTHRLLIELLTCIAYGDIRKMYATFCKQGP